MNDDRITRPFHQGAWRIVHALARVAEFGRIGPLIAGLAVIVGLLAEIGWRYVVSRWETSTLDNWMIVGSLFATVVCWRICLRPAAAGINGDAAA